jgi:hypothetical protein
VGSFTVSDNDALNGSGCSDISLTNNSTTQTAFWGTHGDIGVGHTLAPGATDTDFQDGGDYNDTNAQAFQPDGSSMLLALVANSGGVNANSGVAYATPQANGNHPCINFGGVAGT